MSQNVAADVVVVLVGDRLVARAAVAELVPLKDPGFLEQPDRPVDGGDRNSRIDRRGALCSSAARRRTAGSGSAPSSGSVPSVAVSSVAVSPVAGAVRFIGGREP